MKALVRRNTFALSTFGVVATVAGLAAVAIRAASSLQTTAQPNATLLASVVGVAGVALTGIVALLTAFLRLFIDRRTVQLAEAADLRAQVEQHRLEMEAAVETVKLLSNADGTMASPVQVSAALIVLSGLGQTLLAIDLASQLWPEGKMTARASVALCDAALSSSDPMLQEAAAVLLLNNWSRLNEPGKQVQWPSIVESEWPKSIAPQAKKLLKETLTEWLKERPPSGHSDFRELLLKRG